MLEMSESWLEEKGFSGQTIREIVFKYPNDFISMDSLTTCVDSTTRMVVFNKVHPLLEAYLKSSFIDSTELSINKLGDYNEQASGIESMFTYDIIYGFLSLPENKHKYQLRTEGGIDYLVENSPAMNPKRQSEEKE